MNTRYNSRFINIICFIMLGFVGQLSAGDFFTKEEYEGALLRSARQGDLLFVQCLMKERKTAKFDINVRNENGSTPLMIAVREGHVDIVRELLKAGADVNIQDYSEDTVLFDFIFYMKWLELCSVKKSGLPDILFLLLGAGARTHTYNEEKKLVPIVGYSKRTALEGLSELRLESRHLGLLLIKARADEYAMSDKEDLKTFARQCIADGKLTAPNIEKFLKKGSRSDSLRTCCDTIAREIQRCSTVSNDTVSNIVKLSDLRNQLESIDSDPEVYRQEHLYGDVVRISLQMAGRAKKKPCFTNHECTSKKFKMGVCL